MNRRLKQPTGEGAQLRMYAKEVMPRELVSPLESDLVDHIREALAKMGYKTWSGRVAIYDVDAHARQARIERGWPPFLPALEPGCPDILGVFPERKGRLFGLEAKRDLSEKERASQARWRVMATYWGIPCQTVRTVEEAIEFLESKR